MPKIQYELPNHLALVANVIKERREAAIGPNGILDANRVTLFAIEDTATRMGRLLKDEDPKFEISVWLRACGMTRSD